MTSKEYLTRARKLELQIHADMVEACQLRALAEKARSAFGGEFSCSAVEDAVVQLETLEEAVVTHISSLVQCKEEIRIAIDALRIPEERVVLQLRYLCYKKWEQIAVDMNYSWRQVHNLHNRALRNIAHYCT